MKCNPAAIIAIIALFSADAFAQGAPPLPPPAGAVPPTPIAAPPFAQPQALPPPPPAGPPQPYGYGPPPAAYPPGYGYPPPNAYPPPGYGYPPGYYPPPPGMPPGYGYGVPDPRFGPRVQSYDGGPVPAGFHTEERARTKLAVAGLAVFGGAYLLSVISGAAYLGNNNNGCSGSFCSVSDQATPGLGYLFVPLVGPWITLAKANLTNDDPGVPVLILDGVAQAGGLALLIAGLASHQTVLVRDANSAKLKLPPPQLSIGPRSASLKIVF